ncbi:hypothetical protein H6P81_004644 [Aristolochia fimbriata]|uniref:GTD-binding domain-containing protein n=1 Tax=Aristolochia fimbriata TaxID=158543 RepID=A0AAV7ESA0_ARIFI|nr:hypothetical protein H6P81_004644 [Aristolochia fimbriata]
MTTFVELIRDHIGGFPAWVVYAALECSLILLLLLDGFISFFSNGFARVFGLHLPCLFCTRIDHLFNGRRHVDDPDFYYQRSICDSHALEVSFLAYCHVHRRLANVSRMCKGCLLSFAVTDDRTNSDTYRNLVDILGADFDDDAFHQNHHHAGKTHHHHRLPASSGAGDGDHHPCSCCGDQLMIKSSFLPRLVRMLSDSGGGGSGGGGGEVAETPTTVRSNMAVDGEAYHPFSQVRYTGLRLTSDTESEMAEEDDELSSAIASENDDAAAAAGAAKLKRCGVSLEKIEAEGGAADEHVSLLTTDRGGGPRAPTTTFSSSSKDAGGEGQGSTTMEVSEVKMMTMSVKTKSTGSGGKGNIKQLHDASRPTSTPSPRLSMLRKRLSMRRNDVGTSSFKSGTGGGNAGAGSGAEGETLLHRLKRQVRLDRKSLLALCAELDQERSASAVAANQAMAMINRLQEEKAAVQMDALQYQRMMEEQAEYDQEALRALRKLLGKRERVIKALQAEISAFREKYPGEFDDDESGGCGNGNGNGGLLFASDSEVDEETDSVHNYIIEGGGDDDIGGSDGYRFKIRSRSSSFSNRRTDPTGTPSDDPKEPPILSDSST